MLDILYQDEYLIAINKPSGLLVHRSEIDRHETRFAIQLLRDQIGQRVFPLHRLDKPTSGVLLFALDAEMARCMMPQFVDHRVEKEYLAVVRGYTDDAGIIDYPLKEELDRITDRCAQQDKPAQDAVTAFTTLARVELPVAVGRYATARYSLLRLRPSTGRKHQIRRHLKHIFHPIVGDTSHGDGRHNSLFRESYALDRLLLHAQTLRLMHPESKSELMIRAPLDEPFRNIMVQLGWAELVDPATEDGPSYV